MKISKLKDLAVVDIDNANKIGKVEDVLLDLPNNRVVGFEIKGADNKTNTSVSSHQIQNIGADALTIHNQATASEGGRASNLVNLVGTVAFSKLENHYKVVTDSGKLLGVVKDFEFDPSTLAIIGFETSEGGLFAKHHSVHTDPTINYGDNMAIVPDQLMSARD